jgi:hypothetical protein
MIFAKNKNNLNYNYLSKNIPILVWNNNNNLILYKKLEIFKFNYDDNVEIKNYLYPSVISYNYWSQFIYLVDYYCKEIYKYIDIINIVIDFLD